MRNRRTLSAGVRPSKEVVFSSERGSDVKALDYPVIYRDRSVFEKSAQRHLVVGEIPNGFPESRRRRASACASIGWALEVC